MKGPGNLKKNLPFTLALLLGLGTLLLYSPALHYGFVKFDDDDYVTQNPRVLYGLTLASIKWAVLSFHSSNWHPVTWISHMIDAKIWGLHAGGHHLTSVLIHAINSVLVFILWRQMTGATWRSAFVAAVFAWHPLHVESVAWISERKDVLSGLFWMLSMLAYVRYVRQSSPANYLLTCCLFVMALMCKPMVVTLPIVLLIMDYWPLKRANLDVNEARKWCRLLLEKLPLMAFSLVCVRFTLIAQHNSGAIKSLGEVPWILRAENAITSLAAYIGQSFWPIKLNVCYPLPRAIPAGEVLAATLIIAGVITAAAYCAKKCPPITAGLAWFFLTLIPVLGLVQVGFQARADRYMYIPMIGLTVAVTWATATLLEHMRIRSWGVAILLVLAVAGMCQATARQLPYWRNSFTLFERALSVTSDNWLIENNLSNALLDQDKSTSEAKEHAERALQIRPDFAPAHVNLGIALLRERRVEEAYEQMKAASRLQPTWPDAYFHIGSVLMVQGKTEQAITEFQKTLQLRPDTVYALKALAWIRATEPDSRWRSGPEAVELAQRAAKLTNYRQADILDVLAASLAEDGRFAEAMATEEQAYKIAAAEKDQALLRQIQDHLDLFRLGLAYRAGIHH